MTTSKASPAVHSGTSRLSFHKGHILMRVAATYPRLFEDGVLMELVQNAIDSGANNVWVNINLHKRSIVVRDDGSGASISDFDEALGSVGQTLKVLTKLGRFGIGLISPMGKCERFIFTSTSKRNPKDYNQWTFACADIEEMQDDIDIPRRGRPDLQFNRTGEKGVMWRTEMRIESFRKDLRVQRLTKDGLTHAIQDRFNKAMKRNDTTIHMAVTWEKDDAETWKITPKSFRGTSIGLHRTANRDAGQTELNLYLAVPTKKGRKGTILVGESHNDFRIDFVTFMKHSADGFLADEIAQAFSSGIFEGEATNSKIKLNSDRKSFEQNDALVAFCVELEQWYKEVGASHVEEIRTSSREERYQRLGIRSMKVLEGLIGGNPALQNFVKNLKLGTQGTSHAKTGAVVGEQDSPSISTHSANVPRESVDGDSHASGDKQSTYENHQPFSVMGPKGRRRTVVKSDSTGLQFSYEGDGLKKLWALDLRDGVITFNTRHDLWKQAEAGGDRCLMELQEQSAVYALHLEVGSHQGMRPIIETYIEEALPSLLFLILGADKIAGRKTIVHQLPTKKEV